uniref:Uncharacterized protein n=2 Tax=Aegilops tauschii TaxID=37682 RepID=N1QZN6_AEGTA
MVGTAGKVGEIRSEELASVAGRISGTVRRVDDEVVRSVIDYVEMVGRPVMHAGSMPETELMVVSWLGMPMYEAGFRWGKPRAMQLAAQ